jgi:hypothetical protein
MARVAADETPLPLAAGPESARPTTPHGWGAMDTSRVWFVHVDSSTTKTGYTERNILTWIEVIPWALQSSM